MHISRADNRNRSQAMHCGTHTAQCCISVMLHASRRNDTCSVVFIASTGMSTMRKAAADADATAVLTPTCTVSRCEAHPGCHQNLRRTVLLKCALHRDHRSCLPVVLLGPVLL